ncbi:dynein assembly factor 1, axonemal [Trichonephila clavata]|uniref:Dynein axonemal assembly factor 1 homolog n=1 Tax=Trichonephila clavata TaxID=2740835 RepID=A0A8X6KP10_TRICU|nr:dynein assembly factor 1, axonemal [Trichonephila clavata]
MFLTNRREAEDEKYPRITKKFLQKVCKDNHLYMTPHLNDTLYLHFKGLMKIENLEEYTGLKSLWLENNGIKQIENLDCLTELRCLYLQENLISTLENLHHLQHLDSLNVSKNIICEIQNISCLPNLKTLQISYNRLKTIANIQHLTKCHSITNVDLSYNMIDDPAVLDVFAAMLSLRVLNMSGNPVLKHMKNYRKNFIVGIKDLCYLDDRPVTDKERACVNAWSKGGIEAERKERIRWNEMEQDKIRRSVEAVLALRKGKTNMQLLAELEKKDTIEESLNKTESQHSEEGGNKVILLKEIHPQQLDRDEKFSSKNIIPALEDTPEYKENDMTRDNSNTIELKNKEGRYIKTIESDETYEQQIQSQNEAYSIENIIPALENIPEIKGDDVIEKDLHRKEFQSKEDKDIEVPILQENHLQSNNDMCLLEKFVPIEEDTHEFNDMCKNNSNPIESQCKEENGFKTLESNDSQQSYDSQKSFLKSTSPDLEITFKSAPLIENPENFSEEKETVSILNKVKCQLCIIEAAMKSKEITPPEKYSSKNCLTPSEKQSSENSLPAMYTNEIISNVKEVHDKKVKELAVSEKNIPALRDNSFDVDDETRIDKVTIELESVDQSMQINSFGLTHHVKDKETDSKDTYPNRLQETQTCNLNDVVQKTEHFESQLFELKELSQQKQNNKIDTELSLKIIEEESNEPSLMNEVYEMHKNDEHIMEQNGSENSPIIKENDFCHFTLCCEIIKKEEDLILSRKVISGGENSFEKFDSKSSKTNSFTNLHSTKDESSNNNNKIFVNDLKNESNANEVQLSHSAMFHNDKVIEETKSNLMTPKVKDIGISSKEVQTCDITLSAKPVNLKYKNELNTHNPNFVLHVENEALLVKSENSEDKNNGESSEEKDVSSEKSKFNENNTSKTCSSGTESDLNYKIRKVTKIGEIDESGAPSEDKATPIRSERKNRANDEDTNTEWNTPEKNINANSENTNESLNIKWNSNFNNRRKNRRVFSNAENTAALRLHTERNFDDDVSTDDSIGSSTSSTSSEDSSYSMSEEEREMFSRKINAAATEKQRLLEQKSAKLQESLSLLERKLSLKESRDSPENTLKIQESLSLLEEKLSSSMSVNAEFANENHRSIDFSENEYLNSNNNRSIKNSETLNEAFGNITNSGTNINSFQMKERDQICITTTENSQRNLESIRNDLEDDSLRSNNTSDHGIKLIASSFLQDLITKAENSLKREFDETIPKDETEAKSDDISESEQLELEEMILQTYKSSDNKQTLQTEQAPEEGKMFVSKLDLKDALAEIDSLCKNSPTENLTDEEKENKFSRNKNQRAITETLVLKTSDFVADNYKTLSTSDYSSTAPVYEQTTETNFPEVPNIFTNKMNNESEPKEDSKRSSPRHERKLHSYFRDISIEEWDIDIEETSSILPSNLTHKIASNMLPENSYDLPQPDSPIGSKYETGPEIFTRNKEKPDSPNEIRNFDVCQSLVGLNAMEEYSNFPYNLSENKTLQRIGNEKPTNNGMSENYDEFQVEHRKEPSQKRSKALFVKDSNKYLTSNQDYIATKNSGANKKMAFQNSTSERNPTSVYQDEEECVITVATNRSSLKKPESIFSRRPTLAGNSAFPKMFDLGLQDNSMSDSEISEFTFNDNYFLYSESSASYMLKNMFKLNNSWRTCFPQGSLSSWYAKNWELLVGTC